MQRKFWNNKNTEINDNEKPKQERRIIRSKIRAQYEIMKTLNSNQKEIIQDKVYSYFTEDFEQQRLQELGVNKNRIVSFLNQYEFKIPQRLLFITEKEMEHIKKIYKKQGFSYNPRDSSVAHYIPIGNLVIINIDHNYFKKNSPLEKNLIFEATALHEIIHYNEGYSEIGYNGDNSRSGFNIKYNEKEIGAFLEEGIATYFEKEYINRYRNNIVKKNLAREKSIAIDKQEKGKLDISLPVKDVIGLGYFKQGNKDSRYEMSFRTNNFSGLGMELLFNEKPELLEAFIESRRDNNKDGKPLQNIAKIINSFKLPDKEERGKIIKRSLYKELRNLEYKDEDLLQGFQLIQEAIAYTKSLGIE